MRNNIEKEENNKMKLEKCHRKFIRELLEERKEKTSLEFEKRWVSEIEEWLNEEER